MSVSSGWKRASQKLVLCATQTRVFEIVRAKEQKYEI